MLDDGRYDAFVVWAEHKHADEDARSAPARVERADDAPVVTVELTITTGAHKGDVVQVETRGFVRGDPSDVIGLPCTLVVDAGRPRLEP